MPRYFFDIDDGERASIDTDGIDLPDRKSVRVQAIGVLPDIARDELPDGDTRVFACSVRDETGKAIYQAKLSLEAGWLDGSGSQ